MVLHLRSPETVVEKIAPRWPPDVYRRIPKVNPKFWLSGGLGKYAGWVLRRIVPENALPVEYDDRALKSKDSMIATYRCHRGNGKLW